MDEADALAELLGTHGAPNSTGAAAEVRPALKPHRTVMALSSALLLIALWVWLFSYGLERLESGDTFGDAFSPMMIESVANLIIFGGIIMIALGWARLVAVRLDGVPMAARSAALMGLGLGLGGVCFSVLEVWAGGHLTAPATPVPTSFIALLLGSFIILYQSAAEEIFFRGWFLPVAEKAWGWRIAVGTSALAFAALHVIGGARSPLSLVNLFLAGALFGLLAVRTRGLIAPIAAHFGWNWGEQLLFGLDPNPGVSVFGALFDRDLAGSALWGGGAEGLNASIAISFVLTALILPLIVWGRSVTKFSQPA